MDELDQQRTKLLLNIAEEEIKMPKYTRDDILAWIRQFQRGNPKSFRYKKRLIDLFVNAVYIYDDRIVFVYNYKSGTDTVMLKDIEAVLGSDFQNVSPPEKSKS